ncbi:hypothetical protein AX15_001602 [Amanita polypyramis BW_CC]|nr:hypothetical protein AX15_001602 [Amanita polypyramis BW_CC]
MDTFMNLAKQGLDAYSKSQSQSDVNKTGGQEYNSPHHSGQSQWNYGPDIDHQEAVKTAQNHGSGHGDLFSTAMNYVNNNQHAHNEPIDEQRVTEAHQAAYQQDSARGLDAGSLGSAAAMQILKQFTSGSGSSGGGGKTQTQLISMAMAEASKLFDKSEGGTSGSKQDAINGAAMTVMKLLVQSKFSGGTVGGSNSGGLAGLMSLASKFV